MTVNQMNSKLLQNVVAIFTIVTILLGMIKMHFDLQTKVEINTISIQRMLLQNEKNNEKLYEKLDVLIDEVNDIKVDMQNKAER